MIDAMNQTAISVHEEYGESNSLTLIGSDVHGNSSQFLLVRRSRPRKDKGRNIGAFDWCIVTGRWELSEIVSKAANLASRMNRLEQKSYEIGLFDSGMIQMKAQDNQGNWKLYIDFGHQLPLAVSEGRTDRWRLYFTDAAELVDFLAVLARIDIEKGRFGGYLRADLWPLPHPDPYRNVYSELASKIRVADECQELEYVVIVLEKLGEVDVQKEWAICLDGPHEFSRPFGDTWRTRCYDCWKKHKEKVTARAKNTPD